VRLPFDYDDPKQEKIINLTLRASDNGGTGGPVNVNTNVTSLVIHVIDTDDLPPVFTRRRYDTTITHVSAL
jgi:hypothetical protein